MKIASSTIREYLKRPRSSNTHHQNIQLIAHLVFDAGVWLWYVHAGFVYELKHII